MEVLNSIFLPDIPVHGIENLEIAQKLVQDNKPVVFIGNHLSHADFPAVYESFRRNGFPELEKTIPLQGPRVGRILAGKLLIHAYNVIRVWSPYEEPKNDKEKQKLLRMNREALEFVRFDLENGYPILIFAEGGRSPDGTLQEFRPTTTNYLFQVKPTTVFTFGIKGTREVHAPKQILPDAHRVDIAFNTPDNMEEIRQEFRRTSSNKQELKEKVMGYLRHRVYQSLNMLG